nr:MAG TPA: hypothetical protein [Caudoviricetes sp.]
MKTIRIIVKGGENPQITVSKDKAKKGLPGFWLRKKDSETLYGKGVQKL